MKNENGIERSAILKGRTLVNVFQFTSKDDFVNSDKIILDGTTMILNADGTYQNFWLKNNGLVKANTTYLFVVDILENTLVYKSDIPSNSNAIYLTSSVSNNNDSNFFQNGFVITIDELKNGRFIKELTSNPTSIGTEVILTRSFLSSNAISGTLKFKMMLIEYQDGMEKWDIPYFTGMQSVKMPVLTTTGKNLAHIQPKDGVGYSKNGITVSFNSDKQTILVNGTCNTNNVVFYFKDVHIELEEGDVVRGFAECLQGTGGKIAFRTNTEGWTASLSTLIERGNATGSGTYTARSSYIMNGHGIRIESGESFDNAEYRWIVVKNETTNAYEPYKSNILTVNEPVELRGIGDVRDELDLLTGEVTERIGEVMVFIFHIAH